MIHYVHSEETIMGIGTGQALLLRFLAEKGVWKNIRTVCELGSQEPLAEELTDLFVSFGKPSMKGNYTSKDFYEYLGVKKYTSIDFNSEQDSLMFDLNRNLHADYNYDEVFDLVTNFGTSEHCFNQFEVFRNIHQLCDRGGYMLHTLPAQGWGRHCLFRYDINFYEDLAAANDYQVLFLEPFLRLKPYMGKDKADTIQHILTLCAFAESKIDQFKASKVLAKRIVLRIKTFFSIDQQIGKDVNRALTRIGKGDALFNITLACILKKNNEREFVTPIQGIYQKYSK